MSNQIIKRKPAPRTKEQKARSGDLNKAIANVLVQLRQAKDVTQEDFAKGIEVSRHYASDLEKGSRDVSVAVIDRACRYYNVPLSSFFKIVDLQLLGQTRDLEKVEEEHNADARRKLTSKEAASILGISTSTLTNRALKGQIPFERINRRLYFDVYVIFSLPKGFQKRGRQRK